jgi:hypothetical protein
MILLTAHRNSTTGCRNVYWDKRALVKKWRVQVGANGKYHDLGHFMTFEEAEQAAIAARKRLHIQ